MSSGVIIYSHHVWIILQAPYVDAISNIFVHNSGFTLQSLYFRYSSVLPFVTYTIPGQLKMVLCFLYKNNWQHKQRCNHNSSDDFKQEVMSWPTYSLSHKIWTGGWLVWTRSWIFNTKWPGLQKRRRHISLHSDDVRQGPYASSYIIFHDICTRSCFVFLFGLYQQFLLWGWICHFFSYFITYSRFSVTHPLGAFRVTSARNNREGCWRTSHAGSYDYLCFDGLEIQEGM